MGHHRRQPQFEPRQPNQHAEQVGLRWALVEFRQKRHGRSQNSYDYATLKFQRWLGLIAAFAYFANASQTDWEFHGRELEVSAAIGSLSQLDTTQLNFWLIPLATTPQPLLPRGRFWACFGGFIETTITVRGVMRHYRWVHPERWSQVGRSETSSHRLHHRPCQNNKTILDAGWIRNSLVKILPWPTIRWHRNCCHLCFIDHAPRHRSPIPTLLKRVQLSLQLGSFGYRCRGKFVFYPPKIGQKIFPSLVFSGMNVLVSTRYFLQSKRSPIYLVSYARETILGASYKLETGDRFLLHVNGRSGIVSWKTSSSVPAFHWSRWRVWFLREFTQPMGSLWSFPCRYDSSYPGIFGHSYVRWTPLFLISSVNPNTCVLALSSSPKEPI